jgi:hypothetical protein
MIIGALRLPRPDAESTGRLFRPCGRGGAAPENTGVRFRDVPGLFYPARREMCAAISWLARKNPIREMWRNVLMKE